MREISVIKKNAGRKPVMQCKSYCLWPCETLKSKSFGKGGVGVDSGIASNLAVVCVYLCIAFVCVCLCIGYTELNLHQSFEGAFSKMCVDLTANLKS